MAEGVFGPYRLDRLLGRGGMGEVYRAYDTRKRNRVVALKLLPAHLSDDEAFRSRFRREAEIAAVLHEPHVVPIHDYGEIDGRLFLDMRFVEGPDLGTVPGREGALVAPRAVAIVEQVAAALDAAHARGLIHRDVKPSNILVVPGRPEFVYLVDFGIARAHTSTTNVTGSGETVGTVQYMPPNGSSEGPSTITSTPTRWPACCSSSSRTGRRTRVRRPPSSTVICTSHLRRWPRTGPISGRTWITSSPE